MHALQPGLVCDVVALLGATSYRVPTECMPLRLPAQFMLCANVRVTASSPTRRSTHAGELGAPRLYYYYNYLVGKYRISAKGAVLTYVRTASPVSYSQSTCCFKVAPPSFL